MKNIFFAAVLLLCFSCVKQYKEVSTAFLASDPFINTATKGQYFDVDLSVEKSIIGNQGTIISLLENSFINEEGVVEKNIHLELIEMLTIQDVILSNLTTTSNGKLLETGGMIYIKAFDKRGNRLKINPEAPLYIEIPTNEVKNNMMVYEGERDEKGNMNWSNPKPIKRYLKTVPLDSLDFLPIAYKDSLQKIFPQKEITKQFQDSIYFNTYIDCKVLDEEYFKVFGVENTIDCGVLPHRVKAIKQKEFQESFIATRAFEKRLKAMRKYCDCRIFDAYLNNLDKDLYQIDSIVASHMRLRWGDELLDPEDEFFENEFLNFSKERLLNVNKSNQHFKQLKKIYTNKSKQFLNEIKEKEQELNKLAAHELGKIEELKHELNSLKRKREAIRMPKYGFTATRDGWINIDRGIVPKNWTYKEIDVLVENYKNYQVINAYVLFESKKIITKLVFNNGVLGFDDSLEKMQVPINENLNIVVIAQSGKDYFYSTKAVNSGQQKEINIKLNLRLKRKSLKEIKLELSSLNDVYTGGNLVKDVELSSKLQVIEEVYKAEDRKREDLRRIACGCAFLDEVREVAYIQK
ncbi:hypothetical protein [Pseudofulvibacter geojedonensis]|uniref:Uncharacterized protein n=1 Tax=Pseudofulvibacter geojedonensis TaxID=1123758 RepID=A0ABW3HZH1_9FLAO